MAWLHSSMPGHIWCLYTHAYSSKDGQDHSVDLTPFCFIRHTQHPHTLIYVCMWAYMVDIF